MRAEIDVDYLFGEMKMLESSKPTTSVFVVVESKSDEKLFKKLLVERSVFIIANGKELVKDIITKCDKHLWNSVIGIIDADFDRILDKATSSENIFLTDCHDIEMMMLQEQEVWDNVLSLYTDAIKKRDLEASLGLTVKEHICDLAGNIAAIRLLSQRENWNLTFKTRKKNKFSYIKYAKYVDKKTMKGDVEGLLKAIEDKSSKQGFFTSIPNIRVKMNALLNSDYSCCEFCVGHDFTNLLAFICSNKIGEKLSAEAIEKSLTVAYRRQDFERTDLFIALERWEASHGELCLLRS